MSEYNRQIHIVGGGTIEPVRNHLALAARAYGTTARQLGALCTELTPKMDVELHLTKMADPQSSIETAQDLTELAHDIADDMRSKVVFWLPAVCDFQGHIGTVASGNHATRLQSREQTDPIQLTPTPKILPIFHKQPNARGIVRKDLFSVGFKTTIGATETEQAKAATRLMKDNGLNLVLANDPVTRFNQIIAPEESQPHASTDRAEILRKLVELVYFRSQLGYTRSTVVKGEPVPWQSDVVPPALRAVVDYCIQRGAYRDFEGGHTGATVGHFAAKIGDRKFITSPRKTNFNHLEKEGLVLVETDGDDRVIAYGRKPSVGGQSQRIIFEQHRDKDSIVHFHCPIREGSKVPVISQREFQCGSHECGQNTSSGLGSFEDGKIEAVYLTNDVANPTNAKAAHGPNIVFHRDIDPTVVIDFIEQNFDLDVKTGVN